MLLYVSQVISLDRIHGKHYGSYSLMVVLTHRPLHQFFLESCNTHRILARVFQPLTSSKNIVCKVASLARLSLLPGIICQSCAQLHTFYVGPRPPINSLLILSECHCFHVTNIYLFGLWNLQTLNIKNMELNTLTRP